MVGHIGVTSPVGQESTYQTNREMKKLKILVAALIGAAIPYLLIAFVELDLKAGCWPQDARLVCASGMIMGAFVGVLAHYVRF